MHRNLIYAQTCVRTYSSFQDQTLIKSLKTRASRKNATLFSYYLATENPTTDLWADMRSFAIPCSLRVGRSRNQCSESHRSWWYHYTNNWDSFLIRMKLLYCANKYNKTCQLFLKHPLPFQFEMFPSLSLSLPTLYSFKTSTILGTSLGQTQTRRSLQQKRATSTNIHQRQQYSIASTKKNTSASLQGKGGGKINLRS